MDSSSPAAETDPSGGSTQRSPQTGSEALRVRCPQCHNPVEIGDDAPLSEIRCGTCDSLFSLLQDTYATPMVMNIGHFELLERLGTGGFGTVWKARDTQLDRTVAIKIPRHGRLASPELEQVFFREARAAAQLKHPGIVSVHEVGRDEDTIYIVSDLVRGAPLSEWIAATPPTVRASAELCAKLADALHHAHEAGVVHRDIKPSNIMMDLDGEPHIMDFGVARRDAGEVTVTVEGQMIGTPAYMSPELARGEAHHADRRSDVYSLGVILYQLLTGELPFRGQTRMLVVQILRDEPPKPRTLNSRIPRDLQTIALKCLEKDPGRRYATAADLAADLRRFLCGEPIHARPLGVPARTWRWCKRKPAKAALLAMLLLTTLGAALFAVREATHRHTADWQRSAAEATAKQTYRRLYLSDMHGGVEALADGNVGQVMDLLNRHRPQAGREDLRGFEWYYLWRQCQRGLSQRTLHYGRRVHSVAVSPDGRSIAAGGDGSIIKLWDEATGKRLRTFWDPSDWVNAVAFSPNGRTLASRANGAVELLDIASGARLFSAADVSFANSALAFSPDGGILAAVTDEHSVIRLWDSATHQVLRNIDVEQNPSHGLAFSPAGNLLASVDREGHVTLLDPSTGDLRFHLPGRCGYATPICFMLDGKTLVSGGATGTIVVWDLESRAPRHTLVGHSKAITSLALSRDGKVLASASSDGTVKLWGTERFEEQETLSGSLGSVQSVAFARDGRTLAAGGADGIVRLWDLSTPAPPDVLIGHTDGVLCVAVSTDGKRVASGDDNGTVKIWDMASGRELHSLAAHTGNVWCVAFDTRGESLATSGTDHTIVLWDASTGEKKTVLEGQVGWVFQILFTPDGKSMVSTDNDGTVCVWDLESQRRLRILQNISGVAAALSPDGRLLAVDSRDSFSRALAQRFHSLDGGVLAEGGSNGALEVRDLRTFNLLRSLPLPEPNQNVESLTFSPDGQTLAFTFGGDTLYRTASLWRWQSGPESRALVGHTDYTQDVAFRPRDGRTLASASYDGTVRLWDVATGEERAALHGHSGHVIKVAFTPDGRTLISGSRDKSVRLWRSASEDEVCAAETSGTESGPPQPELQSGDSSKDDRWTPTEARALTWRAEGYAKQGRWKEAADAYAKAIELDPDDYGNWSAITPLHYKIGGLDDYRRDCRELLARFGGTSDLDIARGLAKRCLVIPGAVDDLSVPVRLAELAITRDADNPWTQLPKGMAEYRTGRFDSAVVWLRRSLEKQSDPYGAALSQLFLAMAQYQLGQVDEARSALEGAIAIVGRQQPVEGGPYYSNFTNALFAQFARREAETLLATPPPPR